MPSFDIAWNRRAAHQWRKHADAFVIEAVLTERALLDGRPAIKVVCRIATIDEDRVDDIGAADRFWHAARERLGRLHRLSGRDVDEIEALIALKVPRPFAIANPAPTMRPSANPITGPHSPLTGQALRAR
jgi:hypothetical protein